ncbi:Peptidase M23 [Stanieria cyanosphaera PCC 7437]|uniref:Peptidase M23 n=1 Tax=Stanieria cyanosphaera (strain ATCC 29371 / PCC 7437) TaxID=111780 RepID=K9Y0B2_STAC7|nr:M23 family metallopeptidase [Stanieria cyanosphaera]AFZ37382.1 Peptidase M23 [Stanieria cyanosphaera PCC 7437]
MLFSFKPSLTWISTLLLLTIAAPLKALEVKITPAQPQLGDTISVIVKTDSSSQPKVMVEQQEYPVFSLGDRYRALLPTSPLNQAGKLTIRVQGDGETKNLAVWLKNRSFSVQRITLTGKADREATETELNRVAQFKALVTPQKYWQGSFIKPNAGRISTEFGIRRYYNGVFAQDYYHRGVDYAGATGSSVVAPAAGVVKLIGKEAEGFQVHGNTIGIDHGQGVVSIFLHLQDIYVQEGDVVKAGQSIGTVGSTGASTGSHLHWGLYVHGVSVDPVPWRFGEIN